MIKKYKPVTPGRRGQSRAVTPSLSKRSKGSKRLTKPVKGSVGRSGGKISIHSRRMGAGKRYRIIDFKRNKYDTLGKVESIEYDPGRTCDVALILYTDGERRYILAPGDLQIGDGVVSGQKVEIKPGNALPLARIPIGTPVHNIEMYPQGGGKFARSAGAAAHITAKEGDYVNLKFPSGEVRQIFAKCFATIGQVGKDEWKLVKLGKAGRAYHMGKRPHTRGKARSDGHPLGGSYSRRLGRHPVDKWGNKSKGKKTRKRTYTDKYIVKRRK